MDIPSGSPPFGTSTSAGSTDTLTATHSKYIHVPYDENHLGILPENNDGSIEQKPVLKRSASTLRNSPRITSGFPLRP